MSCFACECNALLDPPSREGIVVGEYWRVAHALDTDLPGWLVIVARKHVAGLGELPADAGAELGMLLLDLSVALERVTGCLKTYVMQFSEGFGHLHVHLVPRMADQADEHRGPGIFARLGRPEGSRLSEAHRDEVAQRLRSALLEQDLAARER